MKKYPEPDCITCKYDTEIYNKRCYECMTTPVDGYEPTIITAVKTYLAIQIKWLKGKADEAFDHYRLRDARDYIAKIQAFESLQEIIERMEKRDE